MKKEFQVSENDTIEVDVKPKVDFSELKLTDLNVGVGIKKKLDDNTEITLKINADIIKNQGDKELKIEGSFTHKF